MIVRSVGMVDPAQYMSGTLNSGLKKQGGRGLFQIFAHTTGGSATNDENTMMYTNRLLDIAETSPRGHPDLRRGSPNSPHAGEARWNPNCSAEAKTE